MKYFWICLATFSSLPLHSVCGDAPEPPLELAVSHFGEPATETASLMGVASPSDLSEGEGNWEQPVVDHKLSHPRARCDCSRIRCKCRSHWFASVDYLRWNVRRSGRDLAIRDADTDNNIEGPIKSLDYDSDGGFRFATGFLTGSGWDVGFQYTLFETEAREELAEPIGGQLWLTRANPASFNNSADQVTAEADLDLDVYDLEIGYWLRQGRSLRVRGFGGFRYATLDQDFSALYTGGTISPNGRLFDETTGLDAYGLRAGSEGQWLLPGAFALSGRLAGSVLVGDFETDYSESEPGFSSTGDVLITDNYFDTVPVLDVAVGLSKQLGRLSIETGYEASVWFSADRRHSFTGAETINRGVMTNVPSDLGVDGYYLRLIYLR